MARVLAPSVRCSAFPVAKRPNPNPNPNPRTALRAAQDVPEDGEPVPLAVVDPAAQQRRGASLHPHAAATSAGDVAVGQQGVGALR